MEKRTEEQRLAAERGTTVAGTPWNAFDERDYLRKRRDRLSAAREGVVKALEGILPIGPFYRLSYHGGTNCGGCGNDIAHKAGHKPDCAYEAARAALRAYEEASK